MEIDDEGLDSADRKLLAAIVQKFASGPVGVAALAAVLSEEIETIEDVHEPFLLRLGFIDRTPQGRIATDLGRARTCAGSATRSRRRGAPDAGHAARCGTTRPVTGRRRRGMTAPYVSTAARYEVDGPAAGGRVDAGTGRAPDADPRRRRDAAVHAGRHERHGQGAHPGRPPRGRRLDHPAPTPTTCTCAPATSGSRGSAACTGSWTGTGPILTDSGGFQVVSLGDLRVVDEDGVTFRSHLDGSIHRFTPEHAIAVQEALGSDVAVAFDQPVYPDARRGRSWPTRPRGPIAGRSARWRPTRRADQALFGIVQGGLDPELRAASTRFIAGLPFDGICIGGLAGDETPEQRDAALDVAVPLLADDPRPRYLMGLGSPADLLEAVHRGVDLFDSVLPARVARNGQLWVPGGRLNLRNRAFLDDPAPVQDGLSVPRSAGGSRGPIWPTCSGPRSCSRTGSRLVTT